MKKKCASGLRTSSNVRNGRGSMPSVLCHEAGVSLENGTGSKPPFRQEERHGVNGGTGSE